MLSRVDRTLSMLRIHLVECVAENNWEDGRAEEVARTIVACLRGAATDLGIAVSRERNAKLTQATLRRVIRFINENLDAKLKWDEIATAVNLDRYTFGRAFKLTTGMTPHQYIIRCRLKRALRLLARRELSLAEVALEVGCSCQSHLTTLFREHLGTTPGAFRIAAREDQQWAMRHAHARASGRPDGPATGSERSSALRRPAPPREPHYRSHPTANRGVAARVAALASD